VIVAVLRRVSQTSGVHVTAKVDYAVRSLVEIATATDGLVRADDIAAAQEIPLGFLRGILTDLRKAGLITSQQGVAGGFRLAKPAEQISIAAVFRAIEGPLAEVRGVRPNELEYNERAAALRDVWVALRANLRAVLDETSIAQVASGKLPRHVSRLAADPAAWDVVPRP
jgi:Rrf2 family protein